MISIFKAGDSVILIDDAKDTSIMRTEGKSLKRGMIAKVLKAPKYSSLSLLFSNGVHIELAPCRFELAPKNLRYNNND